MFNISNPGTGNKFKDDFRVFLWLCWKHLGLPDPTPVQYDFAYNLQHGNRRQVNEAYRGAGKSWITSAFVCWLLLNDADLSILVVSASKIRADDFTTFTLRLIYEMSILQHLKPKTDQRNSKVAFDVGPARAKHAPSVKSVGITGQLAGSRADIIIADDIEIPNNSLTQTMRDKLWEAVKEFDAILKPGSETRIIYLGTPQTEMSLYNELENRGYKTRIWPARIPKNENLEKYGGKLAPFIYQMIEEGAVELQPVDPLRFDEQELLEREASYGRSGFALQFMLDTSLSDAERYPLKLSDLIVTDVNKDMAPAKIVYGSSPDQLINDLPIVGFAGDKLYRPMFQSDEWTEYSGRVMTIDPSGRGSDETGVAVTCMLHGNIYVPYCTGLLGGYDETTLQTISRIARQYQVNLILIEPNFGDGMFNELLKPVLSRIYPVTVEDAPRASTMKEARIIDALEPVMNQHRLIMDRSIIDEDYRNTDNIHYQLFYQLTRITNEKGALGHDDRLEALAMGVRYWVDQMATDQETSLRNHRQDLIDQELERFMEHAIGDGSVRRNNWIG